MLEQTVSLFLEFFSAGLGSIMGRLFAFFFCVVLLAGCAEDPPIFNEVKHPHEILKAAEVNQYLKIVHHLPEQRLPRLPTLFAPLPEWDLDRELSVKGLVREELKSNESRWFGETTLARLETHRELKRLLKQENMSIEQFLGLAETINMAAARAHFEELDDLRSITRNGQHEINELMKREEVFSSLPEPEQYEIIRRAAWVTRVNRAHAMLRVPRENASLVLKHYDTLKPYLLDEVLHNPLVNIVDSVKHFGLPFEETPSVGFDADLRWSPNDPQAVVGHATEKQIAAFETSAR
ncbi:hypothetical protein GYB59_11425 [bacterium]|nr:hypothetical protein [bacterium]